MEVTYSISNDTRSRCHLVVFICPLRVRNSVSCFLFRLLFVRVGGGRLLLLLLGGGIGGLLGGRDILFWLLWVADGDVS